MGGGDNGAVALQGTADQRLMAMVDEVKRTKQLPYQVSYKGEEKSLKFVIHSLFLVETDVGQVASPERGANLLLLRQQRRMVYADAAVRPLSTVVP